MTGVDRVYGYEERVGSTWVPFASPPHATRERAEKYLLETLVPAFPERRFRCVCVWGKAPARSTT